RLEGHVHAVAAGEFPDAGGGILGAGVDRMGGAEFRNGGKLFVADIDGDDLGDPRGRRELHDRGADPARRDYRDPVTETEFGGVDRAERGERAATEDRDRVEADLGGY